MPPLPNVAKVIRADFFVTVPGNLRVRDRIFFNYAGAGPTPADLTTLATTIANAWGASLSPQCATGVILTGVQLTDLTSATGAQTFLSTSKPGTRVGQGLTAALAAIVKFKVARRYRGGHPRIYLNAGVVTDEATSVAWLAAFTAALATSFAAFIAGCVLAPPVNIGAMAHVNVSYFLGFLDKVFPSGRHRAVPTPRVVPLQDVVLSYSTNPNYGSQRRRNLQSA